VRIWSLLVQAEAREAGGRPDAAAALGHGLAGALAAHDVKQVLEGILVASRFAVARGDLDAAALALAATRLEPSTPAVVRREAAALGRRLASDLGPARRRAVARRARALGLEGAVQELRAWVAAWGADGWRDGPGGVVS
jgi:hypothetical protein